MVLCHSNPSRLRQLLNCVALSVNKSGYSQTNRLINRKWQARKTIVIKSDPYLFSCLKVPTYGVGGSLFQVSHVIRYDPLLNCIKNQKVMNVSLWCISDNFFKLIMLHRPICRRKPENSKSNTDLSQLFSNLPAQNHLWQCFKFYRFSFGTWFYKVSLSFYI